MKKKLLYFPIVITLIIGIGVLQIKYGNETLFYSFFYNNALKKLFDDYSKTLTKK
ncbi:hypothetical protein FLBR109950_00360 [Flavobacterium branchiophilum]|uniref:Uncharacterized protein n=1 Tax=Flavobacterium branchiophilum (strain FL-15) TaxID=1034807 RepID=G2Z5I2_FLABF|nr:Hypothetical protein FBFL15_2793 [Flavobacterium branchiophilum FL-15]